MKRIVTLLFILTSVFAKAQDSTRVINHEIGFNTVSLIKQLISNNPTATLTTLPYDIFYNIYYKDIVGIRLGLGLNNSHQETEVFGQATPRTLDQVAFSGRAGLSYNFVRSRRITFNAFADFVTEKFSVKSANTSTIQAPFDPITTVTNISTDKTTGMGGQVGFGVKYNISRHLSVYAEVPINYIHRETSSEVYIKDDAGASTTSTSIKNSSTRIIVPTTIYLVLRF